MEDLLIVTTGGTIDKMESVPGTRTALSQEEFFAQVNQIGLSVIGQSEGIAIADKKMYALRDVTATVSCIPLIASSIMSKKLASGSDAILLDVTTGSGAFMKPVDQSIELAKPEGFESGSGIGVRGQVDGRQLQLGNTTLMEDAGVDITPLRGRAEQLRLEGISIIYLAVDKSLAGLLAVSDPIKPTSKEAVAKLLSVNVKVIMATGDGLTTARAVGARLGIDEVYGEVKPADKNELVGKLQAEGHIVAMAGDGINEAPALARANVGIAMGTGTDVAMNSAHLTLVKGDLRGIATARSISVATVRNMHQNLVFAFLYNAAGVPIAAGVLYPAFGLLLSPLIAALAMSFSSASVVGNALRLGRKRI